MNLPVLHHARPLRRAGHPALRSSIALMAAAAIALPGAVAMSAAEPPVLDRNDEWALPNQDYRNTRSAPASGIDSSTVDQLGVAWSMDIPGQGPYGAAAGGLIIDEGVVYFQDLGANVFAIILESGEIIWEKRYDTSLVGPTGPAIDGQRVFASIDDETFAALDIQTGEELWSAKPETGYLGAIQPTVVEDTVYYATQAGKSGEAGYAAGESGVVHAADAASGLDRWTFQVVEEDFWGAPEVNSGGGIWYPPAVDTEAGVTYWGTGNPAPFPGTEAYPNGSSRPGPNLYTSSVIALDHADGSLEWYFQAVPHDLFDHDFQVPPILASVEIDGEQQDLVVGSGKVGEVIGIDPATQEALWRTKVGRHENDDLEGLPLGEEVVVYPGILGGVETPMAYADGMVYVPVVNIPTTHTATGHGAADGTEALANADATTPVSEGTGALVAIDAASGEIAWRQRFGSPVFGGATVSGDLVFTASYDGLVRAFDRTSGEPVWAWQAPGGINAWPAIAADTIVWPVGLGDEPQLVALRVGGATTPDESPPPVATEAPESTMTPDSDGSPTPRPRMTPEVTASPDPDATPGPEASPPPAVTPSPAPSPSPTDGDDGDAVDLELVAADLAFDRSEITVPAGATLRLTLRNQDPVPHNFSLYESDAAQEAIFVGERFSGPGASRTYEFQVPSEPGEYFFRCDVHPQMSGTLIVE